VKNDLIELKNPPEDLFSFASIAGLIEQFSLLADISCSFALFWLSVEELEAVIERKLSFRALP